MAQQRGLIVLTDSDGAGFVIRNFIKGCVNPSLVKHAYIPELAGKERRKSAPGKEGKLGVEGMRPEVLLNALRRAGATMESAQAAEENVRISKADMFARGLTGGEGSQARRRALMRALDLPEKLSTSALLDVLNAVMTREEFISMKL